MKKLYTLILAAALTLSASAQTLVTRSQAIGGSATTTIKAKKAAHPILSELTTLPQPKHAPAKAEAFKSLADMVGEATWSSKSLLSQAAPTEVDITIYDEAKNQLAITFQLGFKVDPVIATVDLEEGTFTIANNQKMGVDDDGDIVFYFKDADENGKVLSGASTAESAVGTISGSVITFPNLNIWACGDPEDETLGWYFLTYLNSLEISAPEPEDPNEGWTSLGMAQLYDPWLMPAFDIDFDNQPYWDVELQQYDADENIYRLVDPYKGNCPVANYNSSTASHGYIQFNVSDPDHVYFYAVDAGFANAQQGITKFYCYNTLTAYALYLQYYTPEEIVAILGNEMANTTFKDGVVTLGTYTYIDEDTNKEVTENDACFGVQNEIDGGYGWTDDDGNTVRMTGKIVFPKTEESGIVNIEETSTARAEYFNMQGMRVAQPTSGIYIVRKGSQTSKVVIR